MNPLTFGERPHTQRSLHACRRRSRRWWRRARPRRRAMRYLVKDIDHFAGFAHAIHTYLGGVALADFHNMSLLHTPFQSSHGLGFAFEDFLAGDSRQLVAPQAAPVLTVDHHARLFINGVPATVSTTPRTASAAQIAQLHDVPVIVRDMTDNEALQIGIIENVQRSDLNPIEEAEGFQRLIDEFSYTQEVLAKTLGKSRSHIANTLRLVGATNKVREYLVAGQLSAGHARALLGHPNADRLASDIVKQGLSVRDVEKLVADKKLSKGGSKSKKPAEKDIDTRALEKSIADNLGLSVAIQHEKDGGHVRVSYKTLEQLDEVARRLMASS